MPVIQTQLQHVETIPERNRVIWRNQSL